MPREIATLSYGKLAMTERNLERLPRRAYVLLAMTVRHNTNISEKQSAIIVPILTNRHCEGVL